MSSGDTWCLSSDMYQQRDCIFWITLTTVCVLKTQLFAQLSAIQDLAELVRAEIVKCKNMDGKVFFQLR